MKKQNTVKESVFNSIACICITRGIDFPSLLTLSFFSSFPDPREREKNSHLYLVCSSVNRFCE